MPVLPPRAARPIARFVERADRVMPGVVVAIWAGGSIALDDFQRGSDIDLLVATTREASPEERARARIAGVEVEWTTLTTPFAGLAALTAATVHRSGITIRGPNPADVLPDLAHAELTAIMRANLVAYWVPWLAAARTRPFDRVKALHPTCIQWGVFGVPRQYVTVREGRIVSKTAGARIARDELGPRWHRILDEALRLRHGERGSLYASPFERRRDMLAFVEHAIEQTLTR